MNQPAEKTPVTPTESLLDYGEPVVSDLGSIADLTLGTGGSSPDGSESTLLSGDFGA